VPSFIKTLLRHTQRQPSFQFEAGPVLGMMDGEIAIATYTSAADKMKVLSAFIREGTESGDWIRYIYPDEESETVRAKLREHRIDVEKYEKSGTLFMKSLTEFYLPGGIFDKERSIQFLLDLRAEAKRKGHKHARELIDVGDFSFINSQWQKYLQYWDDPRWGSPGAGIGVLYESFIKELTIINIEGMSETQASEILKAFGGGKYPPTRFIDFLENIDTFSRAIGLNHKQLLGRKILLEFDSASDYEKVVNNLAKESVANVEPIFVYTPSKSAIHMHLAKQPAVKFFLTSILRSTLESPPGNEMLIPAKNIPLILDAISKVLETYTEANVCFVFDILSELLSTMKPEEIFIFLRNALDILYSEKITGLFLLNTNIHDPQMVSQIKGLFSNLLTYGKDGLKVVKIS